MPGNVHRGGNLEELYPFSYSFNSTQLIQLWLVFYKNNIFKLEIHFDNIIYVYITYMYRHTPVLYNVQNVHL